MKINTKIQKYAEKICQKKPKCGKKIEVGQRNLKPYETTSYVCMC